MNYQELVKDKKQPQDIYQFFVQPDHLNMVIMVFQDLYYVSTLEIN
jgi:hypothetical protein